MVMTIVDAHNIIKTFGSGGKKTTVLHDISLQIAEHEFIAIMGPSGSGKSTLVKILGLLDRAQQGNINLYGNPLPKSDKALSKLRNETIGFVFQDYRLIPHYSALDNVAVPLKIAGKGRGYQKKRAAELLRLVGLGEVLDQRAGQLSGGQQQRVGIARALAMQPKLLIADEPTGNLDSVTGATIMKILRTIHAKLGTTVIIVTHSPDVAAQASRIITIRDGKISRGAA